MPFTRPQQRAFRVLVSAAWKEAKKAGENDRDEWYRRELQAAIGNRSTLDCNTGKDFENAAAHFEILAADGIAWQLNREDGNARRLRHVLGEAVREAGITDEYLAGIARQSLGLIAKPSLEQMSPRELITVLRAVKIHAARLSRERR